MRLEQVTLKEIELLRQELLQVVEHKGYTNGRTIQISQELDRALNYYHYLQQVKQNQISYRKVHSS